MTDHQQIVNLMKQMGSRAGYNPMPPDQHRWTMGKKRGPLYRFWGWMCDHTLSYGHRSPYAVDANGSERHIEHAAADLEMDLANTYAYWRKGINLGLWRNGTAEEGKRRMFLCGEVIPKVDEDDEDERQPSNGLPPAIVAKVKEWSAETQREFWSTWAIRKTVRDTSLRELMAAAREILDRDDDEHLKTWGIQRNRQEHSPKNMPPEELQARQERIQKILPDLEKHVQTVQAFVQPQESAPYNGGYNGSAPAASLLTSEKDRELPENNNNRAAVPTPSTPPEEDRAAVVVVVLDALNTYGRTTEKAANTFIDECRRAKPACSAEEITHTVHDLAAGINRGTRNPIGMLLKQVPEALKTLRKPMTAGESAEQRQNRDAAYVLAHPGEFDTESIEWARKHRNGPV
jgi:hypothetical protein